MPDWFEMIYNFDCCKRSLLNIQLEFCIKLFGFWSFVNTKQNFHANFDRIENILWEGMKNGMILLYR